MDSIHIDGDELNQFILEEAKKRGYSITEEVIELVLDLELEFLDSKGLVVEREV